MTKTAKHTLGPWTFERDSDADYSIYGKDGVFVATVHHENDDRKANAALIASAPELLEALKHANEILKTYGSGNFAIITNAISKAECK